jgi:hypothetical protein
MSDLKKVLEAITWACREMQENPDDSIQDIFNDSFHGWELDLVMDSNFVIRVRMNDNYNKELLEVIKDLVLQFAYWSEKSCGYMTGGLSALERAFEVLGWEDPHPYPDHKCEIENCNKQATCGNFDFMKGKYLRTCHLHCS